jgi:ABC-type multidrug transport system ATPase subunit/ABC-type multidrug transport system permease subunit
MVLDKRRDKGNHKEIGESKLNLISKIFSMIVSSDGTITDKEKQFIRDFYDNYYPKEISKTLYDQFSKDCSNKISIEEVIDEFSHFSYGEKFFMMMKIYELIIVDTIDQKEIETARELAEKVGIPKEDVKFIENLYRSNPNFSSQSDEYKFQFITISDIKEWSDIYINQPGLDLIIFNIDKTYFLLKRDKINHISINDYSFSDSLRSVQIPVGSDILINEYLLDFEQLKLFFKNKRNSHPDKRFFINANSDGEKIVSEFNTKESLIKIELKGSHIELKKIKPETEIKVNREIVNSLTSYINLSDILEINGSVLNLRKLIFQELSEKEFIHIKKGKDIYTISNNYKDIHINDKIDYFWSSKLVRAEGIYKLDPGNCPHQITIIRGSKEIIIKNRVVVEVDSLKPKQKIFRSSNGVAEIQHDDIIYVKGNIISVNLLAKVFEKTLFSFKSFIVNNLSYYFENGHKAIDNISFRADHGDFICMLGPSGAGKSTLLKILNGTIKNVEGEIRVDKFNFHKFYDKIIDFMSYVPQDDLLISNLTVYENLYYNAKLRDPKSSKESIDLTIARVLKEIGLEHKRDNRVGTPTDRILSGGERKRLNIGLELLEESSSIYLLDEPTSGLSSKDSEKVIEVLKRLSSKGKIIFTVIHQPSSKIYKYFTKVMLLDNGGKMAFYGNIHEALAYFNTHNSSNPLSHECPACKKVEPDMLLNSLEEPFRDIDGSVIENSYRRNTPDDWKEKFEQYHSYRSDVKIPSKNPIPSVPFKVTRKHGRLKLFKTLLERNFLNKMRDRSNIVITFFISPILAIIISLILRYSPTGDYNLYNNLHLPTYIFLSIIVAIFLAMSNSGDEIIKDSEIREREKLLNIGNFSYFLSKFSVLILFSLVQNILFVAASFPILEIREMYLHFTGFLMFVSACGISMGLFISAIPGLTSKAAQNIIPMILIPQIIFGGSLIKYRDMNKSLTIYDNSPIPEVCQFMPSRWAYEGMMVMFSNNNTFHSGKNRMQAKLDSMVNYKQEYVKELGRIRYEKRKDKLMNNDMVEFRKKYKKKYGNMEVYSVINDVDDSYSYNKKFELENFDGKVQGLYPMFISKKRGFMFDKFISTTKYNLLMLSLFITIINLLTIVMLCNRELILKLFKRRKK